jgi:hypothetical protein
MKDFEPRMNADRSGLHHVHQEELCRGLPPRRGIHQARTILIVAFIIFSCAAGCERRIVRKEERAFMHYAEKNWRKLTPRQRADYYEMIERQKDRARQETAKERHRQSQ